jgi:hypothetical protein
MRNTITTTIVAVAIAAAFIVGTFFGREVEKSARDRAAIVQPSAEFSVYSYSPSLDGDGATYSEYKPEGDGN